MDAEKDVHYYHERFQELADEAAHYGIASVVALAAGDPIAQREEVIWLTRGSRLLAIGLLNHALWDLQSHQEQGREYEED